VLDHADSAQGHGEQVVEVDAGAGRRLEGVVSHCGSEKALDHLVPVFPSTAFEAGKLALSVEDAVAVLPWAMLAVPQVVAPPDGPGQAVFELVRLDTKLS
jgi:hypothetical protein